MYKVLAALLLMVFSIPTWADGIPQRKSRIAAPSADTHAYKTHNFYGGVGIGHAWGVEDDVEKYKPFVGSDNYWHGSVIAGYLYRANEYLAAGVEVDYMAKELSVDDGIASVRGRAGVFVAPGTFVYGTLGVARAYQKASPVGLREGLAFGGGLEKDVTANVAVRAEVLHYRHGDGYLEAGDEGSSVARAALLYKF